MYICNEFLSNRRQQVAVDGAASTTEWIPFTSGVTQGNVLGGITLMQHYKQLDNIDYKLYYIVCLSHEAALHTIGLLTIYYFVCLTHEAALHTIVLY